jgi:hypothetical protein
MAHKYHVLEWKATDIYNFLQLPGLTFAVFNFDKPILGHYVLLVAGFNADGVFLGTSTLEKYPGFPEPDLDNVYTAGLFFVQASEIKSYSANGTTTLYFKPIAYSPGGAGTQKYVSYEVYDKGPTGDAFDDGALVGSINPSPPRNAGS